VYGATNGNNYRRYAGIGTDGLEYTLAKYDLETVVQAVDNRKFGSRHPGICQFAFCDGSVRMINQQIPVDLLGRLSQKSDGQPISGEY
jgi:prepilin-type processing-associated H-X9-DG protein